MPEDNESLWNKEKAKNGKNIVAVQSIAFSSVLISADYHTLMNGKDAGTIRYWVYEWACKRVLEHIKKGEVKDVRPAAVRKRGINSWERLEEDNAGDGTVSDDSDEN